MLTCLALSQPSSAQQYDTSYYTSYDTLLTTRLYLSRKYTGFVFVDRIHDLRLNYIPNTPVTMGIGATYKSVTLNLAYGFGFLNPDNGKGDTKYLDLQGHIYGRKLLIDFFGQIYNGFYLTNDELRQPDGDNYYRPDIKVREYGANAQYIFNYKHFSYRAGFLQNEWQKKSAGSVLLGWQLLYGKGSADSTIVPGGLKSVPPEARVRELSFISTGPSIGYAYDLIIKKHFFIMVSAVVSLSLNRNQLTSNTSETATSFIPNAGVKTFIGYNSKDIAVNITFTNEMTNLLTEGRDQFFSLNTGNLRFNIAHRFKAPKFLRKYKHKLDLPGTD